MSDTIQKITSDETPQKRGLVVVNISKKQKKKRIRNLRKGRGPLFDKVASLLEDLKEEGAVSADSQPVVIVVREKSRDLKLFR